MQFFADNYVWFIAGGIIILMAIIGYLADKNDFGRNEIKDRMEKTPKPKKEKKVKEKKEQTPQPEKIEIPNKPLGEVISENAGVSVKTEDEVPSDLFAPLTNEPTEDLYAPLSNDTVTVLQEPETTSTLETVATEPETNEWTVKEEAPVVEQPEVTNVEEDIWKF